MSITCQVNFENNPQKIFFSDDKLRITVRLTLTKEEHVSRIYIELIGKAHVSYMMDRYARFGQLSTDDEVLRLKRCLTGENRNANQCAFLNINAIFFHFVDRSCSITGGNTRLQFHMCFTKRFAIIISRYLWSHRVYFTSRSRIQSWI